MDKSGYDFRIHRAEIDKEDIKYFKRLNYCRPFNSPDLQLNSLGSVNTGVEITN
jgi:hypothetical protein